MGMIRVVHNKENPYVQLSKETVQKGGMTLEELGLWTYLMSMPNNWKVIISQLTEHFGVGKEKIYNILNGLIAKGFCNRQQSKTDGVKKGQFSSMDYEIYEYPVEFKKCFPHPAFPDTELPHTENPPIHNNIDIHKNKQQQAAAAAPSNFDNPFEETSSSIAAAVFYECVGLKSKSNLKKISELTVEQIKKLEALYRERSQGKPIENPDGFISAALKEKWYEEKAAAAVSKEQCVEVNKKLAESIEYQFRKHVAHPMCSFTALNQRVEITSGQRHAEIDYSITTISFKDQLKSKLLSLGFDKLVTAVCS